jgi:hypothetical protein
MVLNNVSKNPLRSVARKDRVCRCKKGHERHLCELRAKGCTHEIDQLIQNPNVACGICGEMADSDQDVCLPVPLFI